MTAGEARGETTRERGALLICEHVSVTRARSRVLSDVSLSIGPGITGLLGANGAGKTTLIGAILGLIRPDTGRVRAVEIPGEARLTIGFVPQQGGAPAEMPLRDVVAYAAWLQRVPRAVRASRTDAALELARLSDHARQPFGRLSGGMQRRALLATALVSRPDVLVLDEPTAGLDPDEQEAFHAVVETQAREPRVAVLMSTHILDDIEQRAERLVVLRRGRVTFDGSYEAFLAQADTPADATPGRQLRSAFSVLAT